MEFQTPAYSIDQLVRWIDTGRLALPEFQREFVWPPAKVVELLDSVARGWPVGSMLILEGPQPFLPKPIDQGPALGRDVRYYVLDGQQRVTALYHAVSDLSDIVYFADFQALADGRTDECFGWQKRKQANRDAPTVEARAKRYQAMVSEVFDATKFHVWQSLLPAARAAEATALRERFLSGLKSQVYKVPTIQLVQDIELQALARIFESVNITGLRLNAFDLMVAVLYPHEFNLRTEWEIAQNSHPLLKEFETDGLELLKLAALRERRDQQQRHQKLTVAGVRQGDVLRVPTERIRSDWTRCVDAFKQAIETARDAFGVTGVKQVPADAMLLALAFALDQQVPLERIRRWYWSSIARQSFAQGANTQVTGDADRLLSDANEWNLPDVDELRDSFLEPMKRNQLLVRGLAGFLVSRGARDPATLTPLSQSKVVEYRSLDLIRKGQSKLDLNAPLAEIVFFTLEGAQRVAAELRKGKKPNDILDATALAEQAIDSGLIKNSSGDASRNRAGIFATWFEETLEVS